MGYFTAEHDELRANIRRLVDTEFAPHAAEWEEAGEFPNSVFHKLAEHGYLGLRYPVEYGGQGGDYFSAVVLAEEMTRSGSGSAGMGVSVHCEMATPPIFKFGSEDLRQRYIVPAIRGEKIAAIAITEPGAGSDVAAIETFARRDGDHYVVNGSKTFITNAARADYVLVVAKTSREPEPFKGVSLMVVDTDTPGFHLSRRLDKVGMRASDTGELTFTDMRVPVSNLVGEEGKGFYHLMWELQGERMIGAAAMVAGAQRTFEAALEYAKERRQFGRPIGSFQVIKHRLVDMATRVETARQLVYATAAAWDRGEYPVKEISMAKLVASQVMCDVSDDAVQVMGGYGLSEEFGVERAWRDSRLMRIGAGTDEVMKEVIAKAYGL
ncbi:MAG: acyl-CoA dehydrogenase family protein [Candidatus Dormibacteria bacterium]